MTGWRKRQVLEMAREADLIDDTSASDWYVYQLEHFAELVRADERERIKQANAPEIERINAHIKELEALAQPEQEPVAWKLVPIKPTDEMLKAMDECSTEGYDERLYAGHAASIYMAAVDVAPTPPQRKPLTDEEINRIAKNYALSNPTTPLHFARAIEAAHGIKGEA